VNSPTTPCSFTIKRVLDRGPHFKKVTVSEKSESLSLHETVSASSLKWLPGERVRIK